MEAERTWLARLQPVIENLLCPMKTLEQYVSGTFEKGLSINTLFEERLFALVGTLEKIAKPLAGLI